MKTIIFVIVVLAILGAAYYFLIFKKKDEKIGDLDGTTGTPNEGDACTTDGKAGTIVGGICVPTLTVGNPVPVVIPFVQGQNVYLSITAPYSPAGAAQYTGLLVYSLPNSSVTTYILGATRPDWYINTHIGKFVKDTGNGFSEITVNNLQIWEYPNKAYPNTKNISGNFYFRNSDINKTPY